ncbi:MAG: HD domain-containing protein [Proteobacteria bacterium]|nr:HD domain-containing protein [Pseudomonadota bacterium]
MENSPPLILQNHPIKSLPTDYHGQILHGCYSPSLTSRLTTCLSHFLALDHLGPPIIPYISAWKEGTPGIWYEFTGHRLLSLLHCDPSTVVSRFKESLVARFVYQASSSQRRIAKEVLPKKTITTTTQLLRDQVKQQQTIEAIYKLAPADGPPIWLKDQASIEIFQEDQICLSLGTLCLVSNEMRAEEALASDHSNLCQDRLHIDQLLQRRTKELQLTQLDIISRLAKATGLRDRCTGEHITKMSHYCATIGKALGVKPELNTLLFQATPMHDVGKIGISDSILLKPGKLTPTEFTVMKKHTSIGAELLSGHNSTLLKVAKNIALTHHERWDGTGYPHGLQNKEIPLPGRITALCDVFDALTSNRPYKKAWPFDQAVHEIWKGKNTHFDPTIVDAFLKTLPTFKQIHQQKAPPPQPLN